MEKLRDVFGSTRLWTAIVGTGVIFYTVWTGTDVTPEQLAKIQTTVAAVVSVVGILIGADTYRNLGKKPSTVDADSVRELSQQLKQVKRSDEVVR